MFGIQRNNAIGDRGSILLVVLAILAVLAITISGILMFGGWQRTQGYLYLEETRVRSLAESGINDAIAELAAHPSMKVCDRRLALDSANQIAYSMRPWGAYLQVQSTGIGRRLQRTLIAIIGAEPPQIFDHVLTPIEARYPLVVSGRTSIHGDVYVGAPGIIQGEINGRGFEGEQLVYGKIDTLRTQMLPRFSDALLQEFLDSLNQTRNGTVPDDMSLDYREARDLSKGTVESATAIRSMADIEFNLTDSISIESPQYFFSDRSIRVRGESRLRNLVLSANEVTVSEEANLSDCLIVASRVTLTGGSIVSGQIIVRDTIRISAQAALKQPALIVLLGRSVEGKTEGELEISSQQPVRATLVNGAAFTRDSTTLRTPSTCRLHISEPSQVEGLIWWEGVVALEGTIRGAAAVNLFTYRSPPTTYMNWLIDARVEYTDVYRLNSFPLVLTEVARPRLCAMRETRLP